MVGGEKGAEGVDGGGGGGGGDGGGVFEEEEEIESEGEGEVSAGEGLESEVEDWEGVVAGTARGDLGLEIFD